jgi:aminopeptidase N
MKPIGLYLMISLFQLPQIAKSQLMQAKNLFTWDDTLRGSITQYRKGWDVIKYDLTVKPDIVAKTIEGKSIITYYESLPVRTMQIDLQQPLIADSIVDDNGHRYVFRRENNVCFVYLRDSLATYKFLPGSRKIIVYYHGSPKEARRAPWDGGLVWSTDAEGNPWIATACQELGASAWWPCKDHQSDEPDSGTTIHLVAPDTLTAISNGRLQNVSASSNGYKTWNWQVINPINSYDITMNIGKYNHWEDTLMGEGGKLDLQYWVLKYNVEKAKNQFEQVKPMIHTHEYWFGKYPFYQDSYKLVETPFLGMEHQSAVAYGNKYQNGYLGRDLSGSGWGLKWDFIIIHESGHEWFGNSITTKDIADMWVHEGFTCYSETLYTETLFGKNAGEAYNYGIRKNIKNEGNIIGVYGVNKEGSGGDMYYKAANMVNIIRRVINNDTKFRKILRGLNASFYHQTVTTKQIEDYISNESSFNFSKIFDQYLRTTQIPVLEYYVSENEKKLFVRWANCVPGFNLPLRLSAPEDNFAVAPTENWTSVPVPRNLQLPALFEVIVKKYYIEVSKVKAKA